MTAAETVAQKFRPFHETIVNFIADDDLPELIMSTRIPEGHDEIIMAWKRRWPDSSDSLTQGVLVSLIKQKREARKRAESKKKGINLDELQQETEKLLVLLKECNEAGMGIGWSGFMNERLTNLHKLTSQALGK